MRDIILNIIRKKKCWAVIQNLKDKKVKCVVMNELTAWQIVGQNSSIRIIKDILAEDNYGIIVDMAIDKLLEVVNMVIKRIKPEEKIDEYRSSN